MEGGAAMLSIKRRGKDEYLRIVQDMINYRREHGMVMLDNILNGTHVPSEDEVLTAYENPTKSKEIG